MATHCFAKPEHDFSNDIFMVRTLPTICKTDIGRAPEFQLLLRKMVRHSIVYAVHLTTLLFCCTNVAIAHEPQSCKNGEQFADYDCRFPPKPDQELIFKLRQDYPESPTTEAYPWKKIDFKLEPKRYLKTVYDYCLAGNIETNFQLQKNQIRKWYHAPWLHDDGEECGNGRENRHGLTRELASHRYKIHKSQNREMENWAISFYNEPGGYTFGQVWRTKDGNPDPTKANFPDGTVSCKLLFTDGGPEEGDPFKRVPFLKGTLAWKSNIYPKKPYHRHNGKKFCDNRERRDRSVYLLQLDVAIKDKRASKAGWVFGTYIYDGSIEKSSAWDRMRPVGLSWGNDPLVKSHINTDGAYINSDLQQSWINPVLTIAPADPSSDQAYVRHYGIGGRLNGPVDSPISSCVSCHGQAAVTSKGEPMELGPFGLKPKAGSHNYSDAMLQVFFSDVKAGAYTRIVKNNQILKDGTFISLDYSLQLAAGIRNYHQNKNTKEYVEQLRKYNISTQSESKTIPGLQRLERPVGKFNLPTVTRGEE